MSPTPGSSPTQATPFMARVQALVEGAAPREPRLVRSVPRPRSLGVHRQVAIRALAEQLVCEANVVLAETDRGRLRLADEMAPDHFAFTVSCGPRWARLETAFEGRLTVARAELGGRSDPPRELADEDEVADLILGVVGPRA